MTESLTELGALGRLLQIAQRDTGQSRRVVDFLLAWYNVPENGDWDPADLWSVDAEITDDIVAVIGSFAVWAASIRTIWASNRRFRQFGDVGAAQLSPRAADYEPT